MLDYFNQPRMLRDWSAVQACLQPQIQDWQVNTVSLDIFDTLLGRIDTPEQVQRSVCRKVAKQLGSSFKAQAVWQARQASEQVLRQRAFAQGLDYECRFADLVPAWVERLLAAPNPELVDFIIRTELELECLALYVKPGVLSFLQWLSRSNTQILAISDMYLESTHLRAVLEKFELAAYFDAIYVSADRLQGKYSGKLYQLIAREQNLDKARWVHIGDNPKSDYQMASAQGIQGIWLYEKAELKRIDQQQLAIKMAARGSIWSGRYFFSMLQQRLQVLSTDSDDFYFRYGRDVLGAAFSSFMLGLQERLQRKPVEKIFFVARDGYLFQQMYQQLQAPKPEDEYIYLSRRVITAASTADGLTHEQAQVAFYNPKQQGLRSICKVYGLPEEGLQPLAQRHGFTDFAAPIQDWQDARLVAFLADEEVQACIRPVGAQHRQLLERYLEQVGFFSHPQLALVDIGWNGTVQKFLKQAFGQRSDFPIINGYYFAFVPKMYHDFGTHNYCEGIIHDSRRDNACERIPAEFEEIFEQGARALEATTIGYRETPAGIEPILKSSQAPDRLAEVACNRMVAAIQAGVLVHWQHFQVVQRLTDYKSSDLLPYVYGLLERAVVYPTREEAHYLTRLVHTEDFGHDHVLELGRKALSWQDFLHPQHLWRRVQESAWRYALLDSIPTSAPNFAFRMAYLHSVRK
ncbi:haloacid dehalogenase superfamily, subfamily IA, variant 1 with third motif having Dx(3-4)D or Dx(3-4)E [Thiothrix eikelboomii]|uniref:Haloacid dehalogenase superfamily, subfamily IA, variant 1 with third motif having Dx(3-4)D or Dx(3-4)E n=1 Tax=Thiothrix eikelboomii TaxID=92487 RepID=A0A1T4WR14_9GAMM|nr:HAD-IA family hydrolase [Thiothrix eikelboomii]SKA79794.1 haloacid dehalogenase superfamily, subfamily IA, variant 1 with third motif having Dx(3-4)D or Dx(3-4)E [Thiothrix eikelboomii]